MGAAKLDIHSKRTVVGQQATNAVNTITVAAATGVEHYLHFVCFGFSTMPASAIDLVITNGTFDWYETIPFDAQADAAGIVTGCGPHFRNFGDIGMPFGKGESLTVSLDASGTAGVYSSLSICYS